MVNFTNSTEISLLYQSFSDNMADQSSHPPLWIFPKAICFEFRGQYHFNVLIYSCITKNVPRCLGVNELSQKSIMVETHWAMLKDHKTWLV